MAFSAMVAARLVFWWSLTKKWALEGVQEKPTTSIQNNSVNKPPKKAGAGNIQISLKVRAVLSFVYQLDLCVSYCCFFETCVCVCFLKPTIHVCEDFNAHDPNL